jgi:protein translocase SecG subunit
MKTTLTIIQILVSISLIGLILLQNSKGGLAQGVATGGYHTKRGAEQMIFATTIALSVIFFLLAVVSVMIQ